MTNFTSVAATGSVAVTELLYPLGTWAVSFVSPMMTFADNAWPNIYWNTGYMVFIFWMYLFHAPFRVHSKARTDWYAQVTKVMQAWCGISVTLFHLAPRYLDKQFKGIHNPGVVFFPMFSAFVLIFLIIHRYKRTMGLKVTFAATATVLFLNALLVSLFITVHYAYCEHEEAEAQVLSTSTLSVVFLRWLTGLEFLPLWLLTACQSCVGGILMGNDFLWTTVCPTTTFEKAPIETVIHLIICGILFVIGDYLYKKVRAFDSVRGILWCDVVVVLPQDGGNKAPQQPKQKAQLKKAGHEKKEPLRTLQQKDLRGRTPSMSPGRSSRSDDAVSRCSESDQSTASSTKRGSHRRNNDNAPSIDGKDNVCEEDYVEDMRTQPDNPPAMVPWFSTLIARTALQLFLGSNLNFLSFDFRGVENTIFPKMFRISRVSAASVSATQQPAGLRKNACADGDSVDGEVGECDEEDVLWFDWTADIGDGFNSTYEIARLLAQPTLTLDADPRSASSRHQLRLLTTEARQRLSAAVKNVKRKGQTLKESFSSLLLDHQMDEATSTGGAGERGDIARHSSTNTQRSNRVSAKVPTMRRSASATQVRSGNVAAEASDHIAEFSRTIGADGFHRPLARTAEELDPVDGASPSSQRRATTGGSAAATTVLPRGSFLLVGGDLAYPSPSDETYDERLFGPYKDALGPSAQLRRDMQQEKDAIVLHRAVTDKVTEPAAAPPHGDVATIRLVAHDDAMKRISSIRRHTNTSNKKHTTGPEDDHNADRCADDDDACQSSASRDRVLKMLRLQSTPLFFAIPGNHEWIDGLNTYRNYIIGKSWIGGWHMPQRSSYFVISLPGNWFLLCLDTGLFEDIDTEQLAYFMACVDRSMNEASCVVLVSHEPGWILDSVRGRKEEEGEKRIRKLCRKLGPRLRMRLCGDIHNYSRHVPKDVTSEAPVLVVSGGGGAFLHGPRPVSCPITHQHQPYIRQCAFPAHPTVVTIFTRLFGFRIVNWQFDFIGGLLYFAIIYSVLPIPLYDGNGAPLVAAGHSPVEFVVSVVTVTARILWTIAMESHFSAIVCAVASTIMVGAIEDKLPVYKRLPFGLFWAFLHILAATSLVALMHCLMSHVHHSGMVESDQGRWASRMESQVLSATHDLCNGVVSWLVVRDDGDQASLRCVVDDESPAMLVYGKVLLQYLLRSFDVVEGMTYFARTVADQTTSSTWGSHARMGVFAATATRIDILLYYAHAVWFYWILATPVVSFIVGAFLLVSVTVTDTAYDPAYSAFQIEDFKHFIRFRLDRRTRELRAFVIGVDRVPKVWERDDKKTREDQQLHLQQSSEGKEALPPHLRRHPSTWRPSRNLWRIPGEGGYGGPHKVEEFVIYPHRLRK